jgi:hypothetical protein
VRIFAEAGIELRYVDEESVPEHFLIFFGAVPELEEDEE